MPAFKVERHKAAIRRYELSLPAKCLLRDGLLTTERSLFDYGCGYGDDVAALSGNGHECFAWDPAFRPDAEKQIAPVVNLGFVLNVIEDPAERTDTLKDAWNHCTELLCVAARIIVSGANNADVEFNDGVLTRIGTFQKYYSQAELREYIEETLEVEAFPAAPGVFYVFRDKDLQASYLASRYFRRLAVPRKRIAEIRYEEHQAILDPLIESVTTLGRLPEPDEFELAATVIDEFGSLKRAFALVRRVTSDDDWSEIRLQRTDDLLVYLALANFQKRPKLSDHPVKLQRDIKAFFGTYKRACQMADDLLYQAGDPDCVDQACANSPIGRLCPNSLWLHVSVRDQLVPLLRIYEGCARTYIGNIEDANLVKLHRTTGKVSYLACPAFESEPHPITTETTKVWLRTLRVGFYETINRKNPPLLDQKDKMVASDDEHFGKYERLTKQEVKHGLLVNDECEDFITQVVWESNLQLLGFEHRGHRLVRRKQTASGKSVTLPKRCPKHGVGKRIGGAVYVHRDYENALGELLLAAKQLVPSDFEYTVVKHNETNGNLSFIHCPDFDTAHEPATGDYVVVKTDGTVKQNKALADPYIYHHKWLFVADDYKGFDTDESKARSVAWMSLDNVDKALIGRASYWNEHVIPRLAVTEERWLKSTEIRKLLKLTTCELAHKREAGELEFRKRGNAYLYKPPGENL